MNLSEHDIQRIVAEVVRRLTAMQSSTPPAHNQAQATDKTTIQIEDKLITLASLRGRLQHAQTLSVPPRALVTPAVRDELKQRGVRLVRHGEAAASAPNTDNNQANNNQPASGGKLLAANIGSDYRPATLAQLVKSHGADLPTVALANLPQVISEQTSRVMQDACLAVWFTPHAAQAVCLASRNSGVWAVQGFDAPSLRATLAVTPANVLAIDPRGKSQYSLKQMLETFINP
jgi:hypothetical protein